jgi:hypothetical protein
MGWAQHDIKYVASRNGLVIRDEPSMAGQRIGGLSFNEAVVVKGVYRLDTINYRVAHWVLIEGRENDQRGYVFGGYLNRERIKEDFYYSLQSYLRILEKDLEVVFSMSDSTLVTTDVTDWHRIHVRKGDDFMHIDESYYEWGSEEWVLYNWQLHEVINIIECAQDYDPMYNEYDLLQRSVLPSDLERFEWRNGYEGIDLLVILEKRYPNGIRIFLEGSL